MGRSPIFVTTTHRPIRAFVRAAEMSTCLILLHAQTSVCVMSDFGLASVERAVEQWVLARSPLFSLCGIRSSVRKYANV